MKFRVFAFLLLIQAASGFSQQDNLQLDRDWYQGKPIREIVFSGLRNISPSELEALMNPYKGRIFSDTVFWEIQGKLYALEYFDRIEPSTRPADASASEVIITFNVVERPVVGRIIFYGNSGLRDRELLEVISTKVSDIYNQAKIKADIDAIIRKYIEKGYPNITVTASENPSGESAVTVIFSIVERDKISISRIEFQGNTRFSSNTLRGRLSLKAKSLINDGAFQEAKLLADRETITRYYNDRGFIDAFVRDVTRTFTTDEKGTNLVLTFMIEEGNEFRFGGITFEGNVIFSTEQLERLVTSRVGEIVNYTRLEMDLQRVADLYFENGYIFNSISRTPDKNYQTNELSYKITIVEQGRAYIENIIIIGNDKTKTEVILREIPLEPGDVFSKTKVMEAWRNLMNLQFFSMVIPDTLPGSSENLMDLIFTVEEQLTSDIQFGLTFSGTSDPEKWPISGLIKWNDRNLGGSGNELGAEFNSSIVDSSLFAVNYLHRRVFGLPLSLGVDFSANFSKRLTLTDSMGRFNGDETFAFPDGFHNYEEYKSHSFTPPREYLMEYEQWYISIGLSTGYRWSTFLGILGVSGGFRLGVLKNTYDDDEFRPFDPALRAENNRLTPRNSYWISSSLDRRDLFYDPSSGYYLYERMGFFGIFENEREHYIRSDTKAEVFFTLFDIPVNEDWSFKGVLALHFGLSFVFKQPGRDQNSLRPTVEDGNKLSVDGMFIGRGWSGEYRNKGLVLLDSWIELRIPVIRGIFSFDLFFDMAGVETTQGFYFGKRENGDDNFAVENMRFSYGGGIRFTMPQFPIRLSLAKRFKIVNGNVEWQTGAIFGDSSNPATGMDIVLSFVLSY
jgi:outer membrane protein insertion porin family